MPSFDQHIQQAKNNLSFLGSINTQVSNCFDWQVTVCFYTALHLVNAHLSKFQLHYRKHHDANHAINPDVQLSISKLPQKEYDAYMGLQRLSRRSRYLVNENNPTDGNAYLTYDKHFSKAVKYLDCLIIHFFNQYAINITPTSIICSGLKTEDNLRYFKLATN